MNPKQAFKPSRAAEIEFIRSLKKIARVSGHIVETHVHQATIKNSRAMMKALEDYSELLTPWAMRQSSKMLEQVMKSNRRAYNNKSKALGVALRLNVAEQDVGKTAAQLMHEQVTLIQSIPREAGERAQKLALEAVYNGTRSDEIAQELMRTTEVTESRAVLIGRTETARANASINESRAKSLGSNQYRWRNSGDGAVRPAHKTYKGKKLDGMIFSWDNPPTLDDGTTINPGEIYNCFPGSMKLTGSPFIQKLYRRRYSGKLTSIIMEDGTTLDATPNHPIFTLDGKVAIGQINIGDYVLIKMNKSSEILNRNVECFDSSFEQIFNSAVKSGVFIETTPVGGEFHGDRTDQEIDVISPNCSLILEINFRVRQKLFEFGFTDSDQVIMDTLLSGDSSQGLFSQRNFSTDSSLVSRFELFMSLMREHFTPLDLFCFSLAPYVSSGLNEMFPNNQSRDTECFGDFVFAYTLLVHGFDLFDIHFKSRIEGRYSFSNRSIYASSPQVFADSISTKTDDFGNLDKGLSGSYKFLRVVDKITTDGFSAHVYNLQTVSGYYITQSVANWNCRCYAEALLPNE